jgi:hypothetical protein
MPYRQVWEDAPSNKHLKVYEELPDGVAEEKFSLSNAKEASGRIDGKYVRFHYCHHCKGWIEGSPSSFGEHTLGPLSGRSGTAYYCLRCGHEIGFMGMYS